MVSIKRWFTQLAVAIPISLSRLQSCLQWWNRIIIDITIRYYTRLPQTGVIYRLSNRTMSIYQILHIQRYGVNLIVLYISIQGYCTYFITPLIIQREPSLRQQCAIRSSVQTSGIQDICILLSFCTSLSLVLPSTHREANRSIYNVVCCSAVPISVTHLNFTSEINIMEPLYRESSNVVNTFFEH